MYFVPHERRYTVLEMDVNSRVDQTHISRRRQKLFLRNQSIYIDQSKPMEICIIWSRNKKAKPIHSLQMMSSNQIQTKASLLKNQHMAVHKLLEIIFKTSNIFWLTDRTTVPIKDKKKSVSRFDHIFDFLIVVDRMR